MNRRTSLPTPLALCAAALLAGACSNSLPVVPSAAAGDTTSVHAAADQACWGQATRVFAQMGEMGAHASGHGTPRLGLRNLARALHEAGVIGNDSLQALGAFVAAELGLSIEACR